MTLLVLVYNTENYIKRCLDSVIKQTYKELEIILIDDGSEDSSGKICDEYAEKDKRIKVVHRQNQGISLERNFGISIAKGKYIGFVDTDDYIEPSMIEKLVESIEKNNTDISICNYYPNNKTNLEELFTSRKAMTYIMNKKYFRGYTWNKLYKTEMMRKLLFDKTIFMAEDLLFNCEYLLESEKCSYINEKLYHYNINNNSISNSKISEKYLTILDMYDKLKKIYQDNNIDYLPYLYIDNFKVCCDIIYRNSLIEDKLDIKRVYEIKEELFKKIMKSQDIKLIKKIEVYIYGTMPILIGRARKIKENWRIKHYG